MAGLQLVLAPDVRLTRAGLQRGPSLTRHVDPLLAGALTAGLPLSAVREDERVHARLDRLHRRMLLAWRVPGLAVATVLVPGIPLPSLEPPDAEPAGSGAPLSRFALLHRDRGGWVLESGRSRWQVQCSDRGASALADLALAGDDAAALLHLLAAAAMLDDRDTDLAARHWVPHDRWFAARSRSDIPDPVLGGERHGTPEPAVRQGPPDAPRVPLPVPDGPAPDEPTLWAATEARRSVRAYADAPVPLTSLGALLWRTLRVVRTSPRKTDDPASYESAFRPVPSGGAMHGIDLWLLCRDVVGVPAGAWRYDPLRHELVGVASADVDAGRLAARIGSAGSGRIGAVGLLTVRHARAGWKYGGIAYALELKDVGVVMHAVQLTAGALGLGMCPLGSGPTEAVARVLGIDPEVDAPVGEFLLGVAP